MKIIAAIITYNRLGPLKRCINFINEQSLKPDEILVVNNSSTDNTDHYLKENKINHITQENLGSAYGWYTAIEYSIKNSFDYVWLMDDDGFPDCFALEKLMKMMLEDKNHVCISSTVVDEKDNDKLIFPLPILNNSFRPKIFSFKRKIYRISNIKKINDSILYPYAQLFNGALLSIKFLNKIGNVNKNYFIFGEEVDLYWRMKKYGKVSSLVTSLHYHPDVSNRSYSNIKVYYYLKNSIINNFKHMDYVFIRSFLNVIVLLIRILRRNGLISLMSFIIGKNYKYFYFSLYRGFKKRLSIDHNE